MNKHMCDQLYMPLCYVSLLKTMFF